MKTSSQTEDYHVKIARNRNKEGSKWRENMLAGRRDAQINPSNIRKLRLRSGIDQEQFAKKLSTSIGPILSKNPKKKEKKIKWVSESTFGAIERGKRMVPGEMAKLIAKILGVDANKLFKFVKHDKYIAIVNRID